MVLKGHTWFYKIVCCWRLFYNDLQGCSKFNHVHFCTTLYTGVKPCTLFYNNILCCKRLYKLYVVVFYWQDCTMYIVDYSHIQLYRTVHFWTTLYTVVIYTEWTMHYYLLWLAASIGGCILKLNETMYSLVHPLTTFNNSVHGCKTVHKSIKGCKTVY